MVLLPGRVWVRGQSILTWHFVWDWVVAEKAHAKDGSVVAAHSEHSNEVGIPEMVA